MRDTSVNTAATAVDTDVDNRNNHDNHAYRARLTPRYANERRAVTARILAGLDDAVVVYARGARMCDGAPAITVIRVGGDTASLEAGAVSAEPHARACGVYREEVPYYGRLLAAAGRALRDDERARWKRALLP